MKKNTQIVLLILVFVVCAACGYILEGVIFNVKEEPVVEPVVEVPVPVVSTIPVIDSITPPIGKGELYDFVVLASVESEDMMRYHLYGDDSCTVKIAENLNGEFTSIPGTDSKIYYVRVENIITSEFSDVAGITGFAKLYKFPKISVADLDKVFNVHKSWNSAPDWFKTSLAPNYRLVITGLDATREQRAANSMGDVCNKISMGVWSSVRVSNPVYDAQNRLTKVDIHVNY